jgi:hypothetical protein
LKIINLPALVLAVLLCSCNTLQTSDIQREITILAAELKLKESDIKLLSSCVYSKVNHGVYKTYANSGICAYTSNKEFHIRTLDVTTGKSSPLLVIDSKKVKSVGLYSGLLSQLQFKLPQSVLVVGLGRDEGPRTRNEGVTEIMNWMIADGYKQSESPNMIQFFPRK